MKHTLQSLLMTTVLTLPTAFGSEPLSASTDPTTAAAAAVTTQSSIVTTSQRPQSTLDRFPVGVANQISGCAVKSSSGITLDFLDLKNVYRLARVSRNGGEVAQPMLTALNIWRHSNVIPRLLQGTLDTPDLPMLRLFRINTDASFDNVLKAAFAVNPWTMKMPAHEHTALVAFVDNDPTFTAPQKNILKSLLPNATPDDILRAALGLKDLGLTDTAAALYERIASRDNATTDDIKTAAGGLIYLSLIDRAAVLYELVANRDGAIRDDILSAADGLRGLGLIHRAAVVLELAANRDGAPSHDIRLAVDKLRDLGPAYHARAATLCELYLNLDLDGVTHNYIASEADALLNLGSKYPEGYPERSEYHDRAAKLYEKSVKHVETGLYHIRYAADGLKALGSKYLEGSPEHTQYNNRANALLSRLPR
jgi:hypothetical protein